MGGGGTKIDLGNDFVSAPNKDTPKDISKYTELQSRAYFD